MNGSMHESEVGVAVAQTFDSSGAPVSRAIIYDSYSGAHWKFSAATQSL